MKSTLLIPLAGTAVLAIYVIVSLAGRWSATADLVNQFWFGGALAALACSVWFVAAGGHKISALVVVIHTALAVIALLRSAPGEHLSPPVAEASPPGAIRAVSFNAWGGNGRQDLALDMLTALNADVIALQEVFGRSSGLADALSATHPHAADCIHGPTRIVSRLPVLSSGCLPQDPPRWRTLTTRRAMPFPAAWAEIETPDGPVTIIAVHFDWPALIGDHESQRERLAEFIAGKDPAAMLVTGDFNLADPSYMMRSMDEALAPLERVSRGRRTWPSDRFSPFPLIGIDHAYAGSRVVAERVAAGPHGGSDHRPLVVDFRLHPGIRSPGAGAGA
ncbi:hypothetical protein FKB34_09535 [Glycocaulis profundi]|nr:hypothetical protein FKB34_09535 [Glycocaulis profundi]